VGDFVAKAGELLDGSFPANMVILRGCGRLPDWPTFEDATGMRAVGIASYPMYLGLARLLGMRVCKSESSVRSKIRQAEQLWEEHDFFYVHVKQTDTAGEDGDFARKVHLLESLDKQIPSLLDLGPDVVIVTGDHSTPAALKSHSWHPVPVLLWSERCRRDAVHVFGETACLQGALGPRVPPVDLMPLALANAGRFSKLDS
jgi:2,3-bisphosphoglycerate-independent phosphoglycerate mutase